MADWARAQSPGSVEEIPDRENKRRADSLASNVTRLKSLALDIDRDAEDQNRYLDGMDSAFTSMTGLLTGSVKRFPQWRDLGETTGSFFVLWLWA
ncbi:hypothetical protein Celaphus_00011308 [Cervus elaphus hippelaphus]|uniref:BET1-like protein n=1 Tax=Cervus elaphus hippelaphus TaxID=46360 RepID=A0A212DFC8_CEREH|nr:hypothetical protein G4228_001381 [Cervus hanglu yarkandensis]OWK16955.1 hypothetical protein Celaphus_00011308 [Cervus elaphus hippelaphus]